MALRKQECRDSELCHCWHCGLDNSVLWGGPVHCGMFSSIPGLSSLGASCTPFLEYTKCFNIARCSPGVEITASDCRMWLYAQSCATPWTVDHQAPLFVGFSRQDYWSGLDFPPPGGSSWPRDQTHISCVSCIGRLILYHWATCGKTTTSRVLYQLKGHNS